jgi:hypothetical protein
MMAFGKIKRLPIFLWETLIAGMLDSAVSVSIYSSDMQSARKRFFSNPASAR